MKDNFLSPSELIVNEDGSIYHLHLKPEHVADRIILVGDPGRVEKISSQFENVEFKISNREFITHTGSYQGEKITCISTGIGTDNIDIVINELDALVNIDLEKRILKKEHRSLQFIRIGTTGSLQAELSPGSIILSAIACGFDGLMHFYRDGYTVFDNDIEKAFLTSINWHDKWIKPYFVHADLELFDRLNDGVFSGITISAPGFYGPQSRILRLPITDPELLRKIVTVEINGYKFMNFEMECSALYGLSKLLGHRAITICYVLSNRITKQFISDYEFIMDKLYKFTLDRII